ncbi:MAG: ATP-dependent helicase [Opitutaceae bacterium]|jgi:DNA helicase-2/ATP-dependent DNA helicase PcrA|nr:ATP-dependent helicase [Opitutaceae bacterium]
MDSPFETDDPFPPATPSLTPSAVPPLAPPATPHFAPPAATPPLATLDATPPPHPAAPPAIDLRAALNDEQYAAVTAPPGPLLVLAGAGSGKTRTLTYRVAYLLSQGVRPGDILLLTFTNKAAKEMLHRVEELTGVEPRRFWGGTFHSIGHRALRMFGEEIGLPKNFTILDADESETLLKQTVDTEDNTFFKNKTNPRPGPLFSIISLARNTRQPIPDTIEKHFPQYSEIKYAIQPLAAAYAEKKRAQNVCDYDDLLAGWLELLEKNPSIANYFSHRFRHLLVDEYQDTNTLQSQIIDHIAQHHSVMAVGDDAQCIYSWRGANFENIMTFPERHPGTTIHRIEINYRSTPEILNLANGILEAQPKGRHFDKELRAARAHSQKPLIVETIDDREQAEFVRKRIRALTEDEGVSPGQIAILYRSHFIAMEMQLVLSRASIPYHITSGVKFFDRQHIRDIVALVTFVYNPGNEMSWRRIACLLPKIGEKNAQKIHAAAREHATLQRKDLIDALRDDAVLTKVPKDARADWPHFCASLAEVADTMYADPQSRKKHELQQKKTREEQENKRKEWEARREEKRKTWEKKSAALLENVEKANAGKKITFDAQGRGHAPPGGYHWYPQGWTYNEDAPPPPPATLYKGGQYLPGSEYLSSYDNADPETFQYEDEELLASTQETRYKEAKKGRAEGPAQTIAIAIDGWYGDYLRGAFADCIERLEELKALAGFAARFETIQDFLAQIVLLNGETSDRQVDPDAEAVKLTTVHQAKGLEYDVVFVIGLADGQFPGRRAIESDDVEEERRLFYVAVTRAKNELYLCYPKVATKIGPGGMLLTPSRFLAELNPTLYEPLRPRRRFW